MEGAPLARARFQAALELLPLAFHVSALEGPVGNAHELEELALVALKFSDGFDTRIFPRIETDHFFCKSL